MVPGEVQTTQNGREEAADPVGGEASVDEEFTAGPVGIDAEQQVESVGQGALLARVWWEAWARPVSA
ncbi:hypothetical protein [Arthrobacter sp.]|uniref:hypothetical protein n=1 Tax=Arthrobacter sp. TaxID=1667 RepID=UPI00366BDF6B